MTPKVPDDPIDESLVAAEMRDRAKGMIDEAEGFLLIAYFDPKKIGPGGTEGNYVTFGSVAPLNLLYQVWLHDRLAEITADDEDT